MTTATATFSLAETMTLIRAGRKFAAVRDSDPACGEYRYEVIDADGDVCDSFETKGEAISALADFDAEQYEQERRGRLDDARDAIRDALDDCDDEATLAKVLALLK